MNKSSSARNLQKYIGVYAKENFPVKIAITTDGTTLTAQPTEQSAISLEAIAKNKFKFDAGKKSNDDHVRRAVKRLTKEK